MTGTWLLVVALALPVAAADDKPKDDAAEAQKDAEKAARKRAHETAKEAQKRAKEAAEEAEKRAEETQEFAEKLAKRIEKGNDQRRKDTEEAIKDFNDRVKDYLKVHKKAAETLPALTGNEDPVTVAAYRMALAQAIRVRRTTARRGDLFDAKVLPTIVARVRGELQGVEARPARKVLREGNPNYDPEGYVPVLIRVNADYPLRAPVSTVPASVLLVLPPLPESLDYRFVGRNLLLRDVEANLIVDYILGAAPPLPGPPR
jgi:hypothetical protein